MKSKWEKIIFILILIMPIIDYTSGILIWNNMFNIVIILKIIFLAFIVIYFLNEKKYRFLMLFIFAFILIYLGFYCFKGYHISEDLTFLIKIIYLPSLILFFYNLKSNIIQKNQLVIIYVFYLLLYLVPYALHLGYDLSSFYPNKTGYLSYFYSGNELSATILCLFPIVIHIMKKQYRIFWTIMITLLTLFSIYLLGTKSLFLGLFIIIIYFVSTSKYFKLKYLLFIISTIVVGSLLLINSPLFNNTKTTLMFYQIEKVKDIFNIENIDNIVFSKRLSNVKNIHELYKKSDISTKLFGLGRSNIVQSKDIEIDLLDIFYAIGIIGFIFYILFFGYVLYVCKLKGINCFVFLLLFITSFFTGHVLISSMVSIWLAMLFLKENPQKRILLISNMYPSMKYKHYGSFVKNTKEILENQFIVDKCVIKKQDAFIPKLVAYIKFGMMTTLKALVFTYDDYYIHFIAHSTIAIYPIFIIKKEAKIILNVHGNDVVADTSRDLANIKRSALALKIADAIIVPSKYFKEVMIKNYKIDEQKINIYPSGGVNFDLFTIKNKKEAKIKINLDPKQQYYGYISRIEKDKGWDTLIEAIYLLKKEKKLKNIKVVMIGIGDLEEELNKLIKKYKLESDIIRKEMVYQEELVDYYNAFDLFLFPTRRKSESLGLVGLEAMACHTFLIAGNMYGPTDYCVNNKNAFSFQNDSAQALKEAIIRFQQLEKTEKEKMLENAYKTAKKYDQKILVGKLIKIFSEV